MGVLWVNSYSCSIFEYFILINVILNDAVGVRHICDHRGLVCHLHLVVWRVQVERQAHVWSCGSLHLFGLCSRHRIWSFKAFAFSVFPVQDLIEIDAFGCLAGWSWLVRLLPVVKLSCAWIGPFLYVSFSNWSFEWELEIKEIIDLERRNGTGDLSTEWRLGEGGIRLTDKGFWLTDCARII